MARELAPDREIAINFIGNRPGDKETEELWSPADQTSTAGLEGIVVVETALPAAPQLAAGLTSMHAALDSRDLGDALTHLRALVPDYTPSRAVLALAKQCGLRVCL
jgi:FlaA1/EpsC-like NDP-sugar epimerase